MFPSSPSMGIQDPPFARGRRAPGVFNQPTMAAGPRPGGSIFAPGGMAGGGNGGFNPSPAPTPFPPMMPQGQQGGPGNPASGAASTLSPEQQRNPFLNRVLSAGRMF